MTGGSYDYQQILENKFDFRDLLSYLLICAPILLIEAVIIGASAYFDRDMFILSLLVLLPCDFAFVYLLRKKRKEHQSELEQVIAGIGMQNLLEAPRDPYTEVFCLHPDRYETYLVISDKHIYFSKTAIYTIDQIRSIYIDMDDNSHQIKGLGTPSGKFNPKSISARSMMRFCKPVYITMYNGKRDRRLVTLYQEDLERVNRLFHSMGI